MKPTQSGKTELRLEQRMLGFRAGRNYYPHYIG